MNRFLASLLALVISATVAFSQSPITTLGAGPGSSIYEPNAVVFDGSTTWLDRGQDLNGLTDGKEGTVACWLNFQGGDGSFQYILSAAGDTGATRWGVYKDTDNKIKFLGRNNSGGIVSSGESTGTYTAPSGYLNVLLSFDLAAGARHLYVNDSNVLAAGSTSSDANIDFSRDGFGVGADGESGNTKYNGYMSDCYFDNNYINFSVEANRRDFIDASGRPVFLGDNCELPTGSSPLSCLQGETATFHINLGTGGGYTEIGTLTTAPSGP